MGNNELTKHYLSMNPVSNLMPEAAWFDIIKALDTHFQHNWSWELDSTVFAMDNSVVAATVTLYVPGHVCTGRATCQVKEFANAHLYALVEASKTFTQKSGVNPNQPPAAPSGNMTPEQIMNAVNGNGGQVDSTAQFYNHKDANGVQSDSVPYDNISNKADKEIQQETGMANVMNPPQSDNSQNGQQNNDDYNAPKQEFGGYSQSQIDRINAFKKQWDVMNNEMFTNYVSMWKNGLTKRDLNPGNIEEFLAWTTKLGK